MLCGDGATHCEYRSCARYKLCCMPVPSHTLMRGMPGMEQGIARVWGWCDGW